MQMVLLYEGCAVAPDHIASVDWASSSGMLIQVKMKDGQTYDLRYNPANVPAAFDNLLERINAALRPPSEPYKLTAPRLPGAGR